MKTIQVQPCKDHHEMKAALGCLGQYFGPLPTDEMTARFLRFLPLDRMLSARDNDLIVGGAGAFPFQLSIPGGELPCAGVTVVGVSPTHRRRGVLTAMMRAQLEDIHNRREPLAALWASDERIYGRFGYGIASRQGGISLPRREASFRAVPPDDVTLRFVELPEAMRLFPLLWERLGHERSGVFSRSPAWWELRALGENPSRPSPNPKRLIVLERDGVAEGYAIYRHNAAWSGGQMSSKLQILEAIGSTPRSTAQLWRYLLDIDWIETIEAEHLPLDHPLFFLLEQPRRMQLKVVDALWVRLVDVLAALTARRYESSEEVVLQVTDKLCPWNEGRYALGGSVSRNH